MADASLIGTQLGSTTFPVDRSKVREFALSLGDRDPIYQDVAAARAAGFGAIPAPPTFVVSSAHWRADDDMFGALGLDLDSLGVSLHGPDHTAIGTVNELAQSTGIPAATIYRWASSGYIQPVNDERPKQYFRTEVLAVRKTTN